MSASVTRQATPADLDAVCAQREAIFLEAGRSPELVARFAAASRAWTAERLADGRYRGWLVEEAGAVVAGVGLMLLDWCPGASHPDSDRRGFVLNLYVAPSHRGRGLAKGLMRQAETACRAEGVSFIVLHATDLGRPLYAALGYAPTAEMALNLAAA